MGFHKYSHAFTRVQLQLIIDDYLGLAPYYKILHKQMKEYIRRMQEQWQSIHNSQKIHPIRIYTKDYLSKNFQDGDATELHLAFESPKCDIRTTYSSVVAKYYYIYPLEVIIEILQSESYYKDLPKNIIINQLLTTENLQIIIETLTIISEEMSKKIKTTLSGKDVKKAQVLTKEVFEKKKKEDDNFFQLQLPVIQEEAEITLPQSKNLFDEEEQTQRTRKMEKKRTFNPLIRTEAVPSMLDQKGMQNQRGCTFCQNYLLYLTETNGEGFGDDCLNKLSKESIKYLKVIAQTVTHFTLYLMENNLTQIPNNIHVLNRVLNTAGIVITEDIFNSELNPKNKKNVQIYCSKPKNLIEHLVPYFRSVQSKRAQRNKQVYTIDELFRMVIYCPTVQQVTHQLQNYQVEQFERQNSLLKSMENEEKVKSLLRKEFNYIKGYENERLLISKNTINTKPIYKQLQFEEDNPPPQNTQPQNYNVNSNLPTSRIKASNSKYPFQDKNQSCGPPFHLSSSKKENKSLLIELTNSMSHDFKTEQEEDNQAKKDNATKNKFKKIPKEKKEQKKVDSVQLICSNIKKNIIKNQCAQTKSSIKTQYISSPLLKPPVLQKQVDKELSETDFRKLIYGTLAKNQGFSKVEPTISANTAPNLNNGLAASVSRNNPKKNNGYSSSLNQFIGRKQEEEHIECMEKLEKETYNRQLLNGEFLRNQIYEEINQGTVKIYDNYANACGLVGSIHLDQITSEDSNDGLITFSSMRNLQRSCSRKKTSNVILENSTRYNQSGIIRNQKYSKSIKSELINHRQSYLRCMENENLSRVHLAQTSKLKKAPSQNESTSIKNLYQQELQRRMAHQHPHRQKFETEVI